MKTKRCQAEKVVWAICGVAIMHLYCARPAHWQVRGRKPVTGSIHLCDACAQKFIKKRQLKPSEYTMEWICEPNS